MFKKIVGSSVTVLVILTLFLLGPINLKDPAKTLTQTNAYGYGTSHHSGGGSSFYVPFGGSASIPPASAPREEVGTVGTAGTEVPATAPTVTNPPAEVNTPPENNGMNGITGAVTGPGNGSNPFSGIGRFFGSIWSWFAGLFG